MQLGTNADGARGREVGGVRHAPVVKLSRWMWIALRGEIGLRNPMQLEDRHEEVLQIGVQCDPSIVDAG